MTIPDGFTKEDLAWLEYNQPGLRLYATRSAIVLKGWVQIAKTYKDHPIQDTYKIKIKFNKKSFNPTVNETDHRLDRSMAKWNLTKLMDLHRYTSGSSCIMTPQEMELVYLPNRSMERLFENYLIPYLYSQSYFEANGTWPWAHYSHNLAGIIEWYLENKHITDALSSTARAIRKLDTSSAKRFVERAKKSTAFTQQSRCVCGSKKSYIRCSNHAALARLAFAIKHTS